MPITITVPQPSNLVGPGLDISFVSDFIGPLPSGSRWTTEFDNDPELSHPRYVVDQTATSTVGNMQLLVPIPGVDIGTTTSFETAFTEGQAVTASVKLRQHNPDGSFTILDSGTTDATWSNTAGLADLLVTRTQPNGNLPISVASQISGIDARTSAVLGETSPTITDSTGAHPFTLSELFSGQALDQITLTEVTSGPQSTPVTSDVGFWLFGVIVRIANVPPSAVPITPDGNYFPFDLAVLRVFRGTDQEERFGIHNTSFLHTFHNLYGGVVLNETLLFGNPPAMSIEVDFALGVTGQVFLMRFP